jgi:hypothetical protein
MFAKFNIFANNLQLLQSSMYSWADNKRIRIDIDE